MVSSTRVQMEVASSNSDDVDTAVEDHIDADDYDYFDGY